MKTKMKMTDLERKLVRSLHGAVVNAIQGEARPGGLVETTSPQAVREPAVKAVAHYLAALTSEGVGSRHPRGAAQGGGLHGAAGRPAADRARRETLPGAGGGVMGKVTNLEELIARATAAASAVIDEELGGELEGTRITIDLAAGGRVESGTTEMGDARAASGDSAEFELRPDFAPNMHGFLWGLAHGRPGEMEAAVTRFPGIELLHAAAGRLVQLTTARVDRRAARAAALANGDA